MTLVSLLARIASAHATEALTDPTLDPEVEQAIAGILAQQYLDRRIDSGDWAELDDIRVTEHRHRFWGDRLIRLEQSIAADQAQSGASEQLAEEQKQLTLESRQRREQQRSIAHRNQQTRKWLKRMLRRVRFVEQLDDRRFRQTGGGVTLEYDRRWPNHIRLSIDGDPDPAVSTLLRRSVTLAELNQVKMGDTFFAGDWGPSDEVLAPFKAEMARWSREFQPTRQDLPSDRTWVWETSAEVTAKFIRTFPEEYAALYQKDSSPFADDAFDAISLLLQTMPDWSRDVFPDIFAPKWWFNRRIHRRTLLFLLHRGLDAIAQLHDVPGIEWVIEDAAGRRGRYDDRQRPRRWRSGLAHALAASEIQRQLPFQVEALAARSLTDHDVDVLIHHDAADSIPSPIPVEVKYIHKAINRAVENRLVSQLWANTQNGTPTVAALVHPEAAQIDSHSLIQRVNQRLVNRPWALISIPLERRGITILHPKENANFLASKKVR